MKKKFKLIICTFLVLLCTQLFGLSFWDDMPNEQLAQAIVDEMTNTELYSQILMFGWAGAEPETLLYDWVARGLGNVKVFGWNTNDIHLVAKSIICWARNTSWSCFTWAFPLISSICSFF